MIVQGNAQHLPLADKSVQCVVTSPPTIVLSTILLYNNGMDKNDGRFKKGERCSPATEFHKGEHWREHKPYWDRDWLFTEYATNNRSAEDIAKQFSITEAAILFWLRKLGIPRRSMTEIRKNKKWGLAGEKNGMYGKYGELGSNWKGGCTPDRQAFYCSIEWSNACSYIWIRDMATCRRCHKKGITMHVHHIVSFSVKALRADTDNLVLLCVKCHRFVHSRKNVNSEFIKREVTE